MTNNISRKQGAPETTQQFLQAVTDILKRPVPEQLSLSPRDKLRISLQGATRDTDTYKTCPGCQSSTCFSCPNEPFMDEAHIEQVSEDLVTLRELLPDQELRAFVPEAWYNKEVILERLNLIANEMFRTMEPGTTRAGIMDIIFGITDLLEGMEE